MPEGQQRQRHEFHVLGRERETDEGRGKEQGEQQVQDRELEPGQDDPDDIEQAFPG